MTALERRAQEFRARQQVRAWEYRQLSGSKGTWYRVRHMLARAREAYVVDAGTFAQLIAEGMAPEPVGAELEPTKSFGFADEKRVKRLEGARAIAVRLSAELLAASHVVFVAFDDAA